MPRWYVNALPEYLSKKSVSKSQTDSNGWTTNGMQETLQDQHSLSALVLVVILLGNEDLTPQAEPYQYERRKEE